MRRTTRQAQRILTVTAASTLLLGTGTAFAAPAEKPTKTSDQQVTEDNDDNDGGTPDDVADEGDNQHPSGKDRSVENSKGNQGRASSDPDDDGKGPDRSNGGADRPGGPGGEDLADQDGNNGCGNDDDFEDDNEGLCGGPERDRDRGRDQVGEDEDAGDEELADDDTSADDDSDLDDETSADDDSDLDDETSADDDSDLDDEGPSGTDVDQDGTPDTTAGTDDASVTVAANGATLELGEDSGVLGDEVIRGFVDELPLTELPLEDDATPELAPEGETQVLGVSIERAPANPAADATTTADIEVMGAAAALPRTGADLLVLATAGLTTIAGGTAMTRRRR